MGSLHPTTLKMSGFYASKDKNEVWECPHCGSSKGFWWSRSEPMGYICEGCGFDVNLKKKEL